MLSAMTRTWGGGEAKLENDLWLPLAGSLLEGGLVASAVHLLSLSFVPRQVKWSHNSLHFLTAQTDISEV